MQKGANQEIIVEIIQKIGAEDRFVLMFPQNSILIGKFEKNKISIFLICSGIGTRNLNIHAGFIGTKTGTRTGTGTGIAIKNTKNKKQTRNMTT